MSAVAKRRLTETEYLAIEREAAFKSEFFDGEMFAMAGASRLHNAVNENLSVEFGARLKGGRCRTFSRDQRVKVDRTGLYCYPDLVIVCGESKYADTDPDTLVNPLVVFEVLSDSTEKYDRTTKFRHYQKLESVQEYVLVAQDEPLVERYTRQDDGSWAVVSFVGLEAVLVLKAVPVEVPLIDIYAQVAFPTLPR